MRPVIASNFNGIPAELKTLKRWGPYTLRPRAGKPGKTDKVPKYNIAAPHTWVSFDDAVAECIRGNYAGIGLVMTGGVEGYVLIDLDEALNQGVATPRAREIIEAVDSYTEVSQSGTGVHIITRGDAGPDWANHDVGIEVYGGSGGRFLTFTGVSLPGTATGINNAPDGVLAALRGQYGRATQAAQSVQPMPDLLDDLPALESLDIRPATLAFLRDGDTKHADRSHAVTAAAHDLAAAGQTPAQVMSHLAASYAMEVALDHRRQDNDRGLEWLWKHHVCKVKAQVFGNASGTAEGFDGVPMATSASSDAESVAPKSALASIRKLSATGRSETMKAKMLEDVFVLDSLAILGQWTVFYAAPNSGKTLLTLRMLSDSISAGRIDGDKVFYINADDGYRGAVEKLELAEEFGFHMLIPNEQGFKPATLTTMLRALATSGEAHGVVFVLDTLKKFVDLMEKSKQSEFGKTAREFVLAGGSLLSLAHVNKHKDALGQSISAGTTDITDDADCAFVLDVLRKTDEGEQVGIFRMKKARGDVAMERTFKFTRQRGQSYREIFDSIEIVGEDEKQRAIKEQAAQAQAEKDKAAIDTMRWLLLQAKTPVFKTELIQKAMDQGHSRGRLTKVFERWSGVHWATQKADQRNGQLVEALTRPEALDVADFGSDFV